MQAVTGERLGCGLCLGGDRDCIMCRGAGVLDVYGAKTAKWRKAPSAPCSWLHRSGRLRRNVLDYGCGRGADVDYLGRNGVAAVGFDPAHRLHWDSLRVRYDTVFSIYVMNVIDERADRSMMRTMTSLLAPGGRAYIAVRRDIPEGGALGAGAWQRLVVLPLPVVRETSTFAIYTVAYGSAQYAEILDAG